MILTEAVIAHALAAIPELQIRIVRIRAAAHGTLVVIPLLLLLLMDGLLEVHRLPGVLILLPLLIISILLILLSLLITGILLLLSLLLC